MSDFFTRKMTFFYIINYRRILHRRVILMHGYDSFKSNLLLMSCIDSGCISKCLMIFMQDVVRK